METEAADRFAIRELIDNWVLWRDGGEWDRFATLWHPEGRMNATWFSAPAPDFIARSRRAFEAGTRTLHTLSGSAVDVRGDRGVAQTKMAIMQRAKVEGVEVDVICHGRFFDSLEKGADGWKLRLRKPVYELDHMIPVNPTKPPKLDPERLAAWPEGYRHLAYLQTDMGFDVSKTLAGTRGPAIEALKTQHARWLAGEDPACLAG